MSITKQNPRTIHLGGRIVEVNDVAASVAITPGMLLLRLSSSGTPKYKPHDSASIEAVPVVALNPSMLNKGIDDQYAIGDLVEAAVGEKGATFYMLIPSGANIAAGAMLESNGDGKLKAGTTHPIFSALEDVNNSAGPGDARIRVEVK